MKVCVDIYILLILFFLILGKEEARAEGCVAMGDTCKVEDPMMQPRVWGNIYQWVTDDPQVPDREEVLTLIKYHFGHFDKLMKLLRYLDGGMPYAYLTRHILPKIDKMPPTEAECYAIPWTMPKGGSAAIGKIEPVSRPAAAVEGRDRQHGRKTVLAIKNNLLYDLALAPNLEVELPIGKRWSLNTEYKCPWWSNAGKDFCYQLLSGGAEVRCWLGNRNNRHRLTGHFLGLYAEGGVYDFQFDEDKGYRGDYYGACGLTYGYTHRLARHLALEFSLGIGYLTTEYRKYTSYRGDLIWQSSGQYHFVGPTKAKVSLVWLINARR